MTQSTVTVALIGGTPVEPSQLTSPDSVFIHTQANQMDNPTLVVTLTGSTETPSVTDVTFSVRGPLSYVIITVGTAPNTVVQVSTSSSFRHREEVISFTVPSQKRSSLI